MALYREIRGGECSGPAHGPGEILSRLRECSGDETSRFIRAIAWSFLFWKEVRMQIERAWKNIGVQVSIGFLPEA
jgi:hypothetical protein